MRSPLIVACQRRGEIGHWLLRRRGVAGIRSREHPQHQRRVGGGPSQRPNLIQRRGKGEQAVARDAPVGRLEADDAAERRGLPDRSARIGTEGDGGRSRRDCRRRPAARPARRAIGRPRVPHRSVRGVLVRRTHRKLVAVRLADDDGAGRLEPTHDRGIVRRDEACRESATRRSCACRGRRGCP